MKNVKLNLEGFAQTMLRKVNIGFLFAALAPGLTDAAIGELVGGIAADILAKYIQEQSTRSEAIDIRERAEQAANRIEEASEIINELQIELRERSAHLGQLAKKVARQEEEAMHWANLASINEELASSFTRELERRVREQLRAELHHGRRKRQISAVAVWLVTLLASAFAGAVVQQWWGSRMLLP